MRTNASQTRDRTTRPPPFHRRFDQIVVQKKEEEEEEEEGERKTRKRRNPISESADAMRKRTKANNEEKKKRAQKTYFVARKNAASNLFLHHDRVFANASGEEEEDREEEEESFSSSSWEKSSTEDEDTEEEENFTRIREKKRKHRFRWECVRLSWKSLVDEYYLPEKEEEEEKDAIPGRVFIAIPGRVWLMNSNEEDPEDENDDARSEYSGEEEEEDEDEDENAKALRRTREDCAKFSKEVINRIVFGVAWKKVHENSLGTTNNTITWSKYNRDPLDTMNTDEYEEDVYDRELHAKARFDRRWVLEERVNWLNSFRKIVRKFREESFGIVGGKSRGGEEEEGGGEGDGGEKKKKKEKSDTSLGLQKALVEDAVFRDAAIQATRRWPLPVEGEEKAFPMYDEWAEKEDPKKKQKQKKQKKNKKEEAENDGRGKARKIDDEDVVIIEEDDDKETKDLVRLVQNIKRKFGSPTKRAPGPSKRQHERPTERASAVIAQDLSTLAINLENYKRALIILIKCVNEESASWESAEQELIARRALRRQMQYSYPANPRKDELKRELVEIRKKRLENLRLQSRNEFDSERYMAELLTEEKEKEWKRQELQEKAMATPQHSTYNTEPMTLFPGVQNIGKQDGSKSNDKKQTTTTTTKKKKKKKKPKEPKISKKKAKKVQKKEKKKKETEEEEVVTGKIELEHLAPGMSIEIDSGDPEDPWWGEIVRLKKSDASIESKDEDEVEITWIVKNSRGKYEYLKGKGGRGRQNDVINVYSIKECGFHLPCAQASHKKRQNIAAKRSKPPKN